MLDDTYHEPIEIRIQAVNIGFINLAIYWLGMDQLNDNIILWRHTAVFLSSFPLVDIKTTAKFGEV